MGKRHISIRMLLLLLGGGLLPGLMQAQIGVGTTSPHPSAMMHVSPGAGNNKGMLVPAMTSAQRMLLDSTQNIARGLVVFDKDLQKFYYFNNVPSKWYEIDHDWIRKDVPGAGFVVGTHIYSGVAGNVGIGTGTAFNPPAKLTVVGEGIVGDNAFTTGATVPARSLAIDSWVGISTRTRTAGYTLDVKGQARVKGTTGNSSQLNVVGSVTTYSSFEGSVPFGVAGEGMVKQGQIIMYYGSLASFSNGLGSGEYTGWALCDGRNNTPDLRGQFVVGATDNSSFQVYINSEKNLADYRATTDVGRGVDSVGGEREVTIDLSQIANHDHAGSNTSTNGSHTHTYNSPNGCYDLALVGASGCFFAKPNVSTNTGSAGNHTHTPIISPEGGGNPHENRPPYFTLAYIMKL